MGGEVHAVLEDKLESSVKSKRSRATFDAQSCRTSWLAVCSEYEIHGPALDAQVSSFQVAGM